MFSPYILAAFAALVLSLGASGLYIRHLLTEQGANRAQLEQLEAVNQAALQAAGRLTAENLRLDATLAARGAAGAAIDRQAGESRRRLDDALQSAPEWADSPVPSVVGGLLADDGRGAGGGNASPAPAGADGAPPGAGVPGGP